MLIDAEFRSKQTWLISRSFEKGRIWPTSPCRKNPPCSGVSFDCDVYIPDIAVSRQHCRFEFAAGGWEAVDLSSKNGIYYQGQRVVRRALHHGDILELGTVALRFDEGELPPGLSTPTPFGEGMRLAELMNTLFTGDVRPIEYMRANVRVPRWAKDTAAPESAEEEAVVVIEPPMEWTELDLEIQVAAQIEQEIEPDNLPVWVPAWMAARARAEFGDARATADTSETMPPIAHIDQLSEGEVGRYRAIRRAENSSKASPARLSSVTESGPQALPWDVNFQPLATPTPPEKKRVRKRESTAARVVKATSKIAPRRPLSYYFGVARELDFSQVITVTRDAILQRPRLALCLAVLALGSGVGFGAFELMRPTYHLPKDANMTDPNNYTD